MRLPLINEEDPTSVDFDQLNKMVDVFMEKGFTYFDTAYVYHGQKSEDALKRSLVERYPREAYTVATKLPSGHVKSKEDRDRIFNEQLERCGLKYFDYYLLHCVMKKNYEEVFDNFDCFNWLKAKKEAGLIKNIGFSFHDNAELLDKILTKYPFLDFVQLQINYLDWETEDIQSRKVYEVCCKHGIKVSIMEPVKGGALAMPSKTVEKLFKDYDSTKSIPSWAIRFAATLENAFVVLSGMSNLEQTIDNTNTMDNFVPLTKQENDMCLKAAEIIKSERAIKCTACSYCTAGCPKQIDIPRYFKMYNSRKQAVSEGTLSRNKGAYEDFIKSNPKPADCIECGQCEGVCPQHLTIRQYLKDIVAEYEA